MPRSTPSKADQQLIEYDRQLGVNVTGRQLERWRGSGLLPPKIRHYPGGPSVPVTMATVTALRRGISTVAMEFRYRCPRPGQLAGEPARPVAR